MAPVRVMGNGTTVTSNGKPGAANGHGSGEALCRQGLPLEQHGDLSGAEAEYRQADELGHAKGAFRLAGLLAARGDLTGAEAAYRRAEARGDAVAASNLGVLLEQRGDLEEAEAAYHRADEMGDATGAFNLAALLAERGDLLGAANAYWRASERGDVEGSCNLGLLLEHLGQLSGAETAYRRADEQGHAKGAFHRAGLLAGRGDLAGAEAAYLRAEERGYTLAASNLGVLLEQCGKLEAAEEAYRRADQRGEASRAFNLGGLLAERGDLAGAADAFRQAADRGDAEAARNLALLEAARLVGRDADDQPVAGGRADEVSSSSSVQAQVVDEATTAVALPKYERRTQRQDPIWIAKRRASAPSGHAVEADAPAEAPKDRSRVGGNFGALAGGQLVTWTMTLLWTLIVPRALGPVGLGLVVSAQSVSGVLTIVLGVGARQYLVREIVVDRDRASELVRTAIVLRLTLAPVVAIAAVIWAHVAHYGHDASLVLYLVTMMAIVTLLAEPFQAAFQANERMKYLAYGDVINKTQQSLIGIGLVTIGFGAIAIAANMAVTSVVVVLFYAGCLRRFVRLRGKTNVRMMGTMVKQSTAYWLTWFFGFFYFWIDTIMLSLMTRSKVVGWYGATTTLFLTLSFLPSLVATVWLPRLVAAFTEGRSNLLKTARTPLEFILVVSVPIAAGTVMLAGPLIHTIYGPAFAPAVPVMIILACIIPSGYLNIILIQVLIAAKRQALWTYVMVAAAVINPLMNLVLIPATESRYHNGAIGAAISLLITEGLMTVVAFIWVGRHVFDRYAIRRCLLACLASAGMLLVAYFAHPLGTPLSLLAGSSTLVLLTLVLRIPTPDEIALVRGGIARAGRVGGALLTRKRIAPVPAVGEEAG